MAPGGFSAGLFQSRWSSTAGMCKGPAFRAFRVRRASTQPRRNGSKGCSSCLAHLNSKFDAAGPSRLMWMAKQPLPKPALQLTRLRRSGGSPLRRASVSEIRRISRTPGKVE